MIRQDASNGGRRFDREATAILEREPAERHAAAAIDWCDRHAKMFASGGFTLEEFGERSRHTASAKKLLALAATACPPLAHFASRLEAIANAAHKMPDCDALAIVAVLWPVREHPSRYAEVLREWATARSEQCGRRCSLEPAASLAGHLHDFPELSYALLDGVRAAGRICEGCRRPPADVWSARVVLARLANGCDPVPSDEVALAATPTEIVLQDEIARAFARRVFAQDRATELLQRVHAVVDDEGAEGRFAALALSLASPAHHARGVERAAALWERDPMNAMFGELAGACQGPGWGASTSSQEAAPAHACPLAALSAGWPRSFVAAALPLPSRCGRAGRGRLGARPRVRGRVPPPTRARCCATGRRAPRCTRCDRRPPPGWRRFDCDRAEQGGWERGSEGASARGPAGACTLASDRGRGARGRRCVGGLLASGARGRQRAVAATRVVPRATSTTSLAARFPAANRSPATLISLADSRDLERLIVLPREDKAGRESYSARFERSTEGGARVLIDLLENVVGVVAGRDRGDQIVRVTFPSELLVAVARVRHAAGCTNLVPGLERFPRQRRPP